MVNPLVDRATSDMLIGPDWAMNLEICDICNYEPSQAKDVVKGIRKRIRSKSAKVQLLSLTLLETMVKNCSDIVHMYIAEIDVLHEMVKIVRKKHDLRVKEKVLILIDNWQEVFGGARGRYSQYFAAYQELLRMGAVFPQSNENFVPVFTPPQSRPLTAYPQNMCNPDIGKDIPNSSTEDDYPTLSLTELHSARGIMDVLREMLSALNSENKEELKQEVVIHLVDQCRMYKQRVVHLVNFTSDESLLCQGLALNDDLQRLLAKHESLFSGNCSTLKSKPKSKPEPIQVPPTVDSLVIDTGSTSTANIVAQLPSPATNLLPSLPKPEPKIDLLSGDDFGSPRVDNSLAIVPANEPRPTSPSSPQNALALVDMFSVNNNNPQSPYVGSQTYTNLSPHPQFQQSFQASFYSNGSNAHNMMMVPYDQAIYAQTNSHPWNGHLMQQPNLPVYGGQTSDAFPPPPWEIHGGDNPNLSPTHHHNTQQQMEHTPSHTHALPYHNLKWTPSQWEIAISIH